MAKCFLAEPDADPDYIIARSEGKVRNPFFGGPHSRDFIGRKKKFVTEHYHHGDGTKTKGEFIYDNLDGVRCAHRSRDNSNPTPKLFIGSAGQTRTYLDSFSLFVIGSRNNIIQIFQSADVNTEIVLNAPVFIGLCRWRNILSSDTIGIRIKSGGPASPRQGSKKPHFWDTDVTQLIGAAGNVVHTHGGSLALHVKNIIDGGG